MTHSLGHRAGFYFSAMCAVIGSLTMCLIDVHRKNLRKRHKKHQRVHSKKSAKSVGNGSLGGPHTTHSIAGEGGDGLCIGANEEADVSSPSSHRAAERKLSFTDQDDMMPPVALLSHQRSFTYDDLIHIKNKPELTLFSEEGIADMDLPDHLFMEELEYLDNITSCNKVENCVMLSEYEQNLIKETESPPGGYGRRGRKWSLFRQPSNGNSDASPELTIGVGGVRQSSFSLSSCDNPGAKRKAIASAAVSAANNNKEIPVFPNTAAWNSRLQMPSSSGPKRSITVIEEASV